MKTWWVGCVQLSAVLLSVAALPLCAEDLTSVKPPTPPPDFYEGAKPAATPPPAPIAVAPIPEAPREVLRRGEIIAPVPPAAPVKAPARLTNGNSLVIPPAPPPPTFAERLPELIRVKEAELKRLQIRFDNARKRHAPLMKEWDERSAVEGRAGLRDIAEKHDAAVEEITAAQTKLWDADDELQELKGEPYHARTVLKQNGPGGYRGPNFIVGSNPLLITWEADVNYRFAIQIVKADGTPLDTFTTRRGQKQLTAPGSYYLEITSRNGWYLQVDRLAPALK